MATHHKLFSGASLLPGLWLLFLICQSCAVRAASSDLPVRALSLPEPDLVNKYLLNSCSNWTNPLLGGQPRSLQVVKCRSLSSGPAYDLYQVQSPRGACEQPPPLVYSEHHKGKTTTQWLKVIGVFVCVAIAGGLAIFVAFLIVAMLIAFGFALVAAACFSVDVMKPETLEASSQSEDSKDPTDFSVETVTGARSPTRLTGRKAPHKQPKKFLFATARLYALFCLLATPLALRASTQIADCFDSLNSFEPLGPVRIPDPSQGLNQYLSSQPGGANLTLNLCSTEHLNFYIGFPGDCAHLGEPYGDRLPQERRDVDACPGPVFRTLVQVSVHVTIVLVCFAVCSGIVRLFRYCLGFGSEGKGPTVVPATDKWNEEPDVEESTV